MAWRGRDDRSRGWNNSWNYPQPTDDSRRREPGQPPPFPKEPPYGDAWWINPGPELIHAVDGKAPPPVIDRPDLIPAVAGKGGKAPPPAKKLSGKTPPPPCVGWGPLLHRDSPPGTADPRGPPPSRGGTTVALTLAGPEGETTILVPGHTQFIRVKRAPVAGKSPPSHAFPPSQTSMGVDASADPQQQEALTGGPPTAGSIDEPDEWELVAKPVQDASYPPQQTPVQHPWFPAVAETGPFDLQYFSNFEMSETSSHQQHNAALKFFRDTTEAEGGLQLVFDNTCPYWVPRVQHFKGEDYAFHTDGWGNDWTWQEMVANMDEKSIQMVLQGLPSDEVLVANWADAGGHSLTGCRIQSYQSYDVKRANAAKKKAAEAKRQGAAVAAYDPDTTVGQFAELGIVSAARKQVWDFVLVRDDGSQVFLHPNWRGGTFKCFLVDAGSCTPLPDHEVPRSGKTGPFKKFKDKAATHTLRFDCEKNAAAKAKQYAPGTAYAAAKANAKAGRTSAVAEQQGSAVADPLH